MPKEVFRFKCFVIQQDKAAFKVGTDGVMLGGWASVAGVRTVLDIGTGTGLLALMLAQRCDARITGLEIDEASFQQALENARGSAWSERIEMKHHSLQEHIRSCRQAYDLIICNPPYFEDSLKSGNDARDVARHTIKLTPDDLIEGVKALLATRGRFCLILPSDKVKVFVADCRVFGLYLRREMAVKTTGSHPAKRHLLELTKSPAANIEREEITIEGSGRHQYTDAYRKLTKDFYLAF
jgi:tRNA1Val (adenine37-N6)-methyltransferase